MARIFMTGFESGSPAAFTTVGGLTASTTQKRTGTYAGYLNNQQGVQRAYIGSGLLELYIRCAVYITGGYGGGQNRGIIFYLTDSAGTVQAGVGWTGATNKITVHVGDFSSTAVITSTNVFSVNNWYCIELYYKSDNSAGVLTLRVNGVAEGTFNGDTQKSAIAGANYFGIGACDGLLVANGYYDDIAINDTTGGVNDSWIGQGGIRPLLVDGAGTNTGLTPSTGANYACVDEVPASDTDYVSGSTPDAYDLYTVDDSAMPAAGSVSAVKWIARAKVTEDAANITPVIRSESTTEQQSDIALSTSFAVKELLMDVDPIDDGAWTLTKVGALEIGAAVG